jgi:hypothetical protein
MQPQEIANVIIEELLADKKISNVKLIQKESIRFQDHKALKLLFSYEGPTGAYFKTLFYGFQTEDAFINLRYSAGDRHYFQKDIDAFNQILATFQLISN